MVEWIRAKNYFLAKLAAAAAAVAAIEGSVAFVWKGPLAVSAFSANRQFPRTMGQRRS